ncbi:MAG: hypothetical protein Q8M07_14430 [Prosthecobacter sp.]|nr:hypothetical protein [Prosthecobacter sp.]
MTLSLTLPDRIGQALKNKAQEFDMQPHDWLKQMLFAGTMNKEGVLLKLELPAPEHDPAQALLPLGGGAIKRECCRLN